MSKMSQITDDELKKIKSELQSGQPQPVRSWQIKQVLINKGIYLDESTIRGRLVASGDALSGICFRTNL